MPIKAGLRRLASQPTTYPIREITFWRTASGQIRFKEIPRVCSISGSGTPEGNPIAFVYRPAPKDGYGSPSRQLGSHLIHAGFVVKDLAAANRFYVELLGFRLYWQGGFKDNSVDWYELQRPDGPDWIEYMLNIPTDADHHELGVQNHFSFGVKDVHAAAAELRARGWKTFDGPEIGRDGKDSLDAYDPDGTRVEMMEFTPVQKPCCHPYTAGHPKP